MNNEFKLEELEAVIAPSSGSESCMGVECWTMELVQTVTVLEMTCP